MRALAGSVRRILGRPALRLARLVLRSRGWLEAKLVWVETRPYQPGRVSFDGVVLAAEVTVVSSGRHPVLEVARGLIERIGGPVDARLQGLEAILLGSERDDGETIRRNAYLTADRDQPLTVRQDLERLSLPASYRRFLYGLTRALRPRFALELGTAHAMSAVYLGAALEDEGAGHLHTIDGEPQRRARAQANIAAALGPTGRVTSHLGLFAEVLPQLLPRLESQLDLVFDDGPHLPEITLSSFEVIAPHLAPGSVYVMDDIDHPTGNRRAWEAIRSGPEIAAWLELNGRIGLCVRK